MDQDLFVNIKAVYKANLNKRIERALYATHSKDKLVLEIKIIILVYFID